MSTPNGKNGTKSIQDLIGLVIKVGGLLVATGILYQSVQDTKRQVILMSEQQATIARDLAEFRLRNEGTLADMQARLRAIESQGR